MGKKRFATLFALLVLAVLLCPVAAFAEKDSGEGSQVTPVTVQAAPLQVQNGPAIELTRNGEDATLFSDGEAVFNVSVNGLNDASYTMHVAIGQAGKFDDKTRTFSVPVPEGAFVYNQAAGTITIDGSKLEQGNFTSCFIMVRVWASDSNGSTVLAEGANGIEYREASIGYDFNDMNECDMLPDWNKTINRWREVRVENTQHPNGADFRYEVMNVASDNSAVLEVTKEYKDNNTNSEEYSWRYKAVSYGDATVTVTYKNPVQLGGETKTRAFTVHVKHDVYHVNVGVASDSSELALPGRSITLIASGKHDIDYDESENPEALSYEWSLLGDGNSYAQLAVDPGDPTKATVTFRNLTDAEAQDEEGFWQDVRVQVIMKGKKLDEAQAEERDRDDVRLVMASDYYDVWVQSGSAWSTAIDGNLDAGCSLSMTPELRHYAIPADGASDYKRVNAKFRWFYQSDAVNVCDESNNIVGGEFGSYDDNVCQTGKFTITRDSNCDWDSDITLVALWDEQAGQDPKTRVRNFHLNGKNYDDLGFDTPFDTDKVYSDGSLALTLDMDDGISIVPEFTVSAKELDDGVGTVTLTRDTHYTVDAANKTVTLHGQALRNAKVTKVTVKAELKVEGVGEPLGSEERDIEVRDAFVDYRLPGNDNLLIGWSGVVNNKGTAYVENTAHPNGDEIDFAITNVQFSSFTPETGVVKVEKEYENNDSTSGNYWWRYTAEGYGQARLTIQYTDLDNTPQTDPLEVNVSPDVYRVDVESETGSTKSLPGGTITLVAKGVHEMDENGSEDEALSYEWSLLGDGNSYAQLAVDPGDPTKATVTFRNLTDAEAQDEEGFWQDVRVQVIMKGKKLDEAQAGERACDEIELMVADSYAEIAPTQLESDLGLFRSLSISPELRIYSMDNPGGYETVEDVTFRWSFNPDAVQVTCGSTLVGNGSPFEWSGNTFSILRISNWDTFAALSADWTNEDGDDDHEDRTFRFDGVEPLVLGNLKLDASFDDVDGFVEAENAKYCVVDQDGATVNPILGIVYDGVALPAGTYTVSYEKFSDTSTQGHPIWEPYASNDLQEGSMYRVVVNGNEGKGFQGQQAIDGSEFWVITKHVLWPYKASFGQAYEVGLEDWPWYRYDIPYGTAPDLELSLWGSFNGQVLDPENYTVSWYDRTVSPDTIYNEEAHAAAKLDDRPTEVGQYYCCYEGKNPYKDGGVVLFNITPRLIADAAISGISDKAYTGAPLKQTIKVKVGGVTLREGTDYTVSYANNTKAGIATVTVTGMGNYMGKASRTFRISAPPAAPAPAPVAAAVGTVIGFGADSFVVTAGGAAPEVAFAQGGSAKSINVPATIQDGGITYAVTSVLKSATKGKKKLKKLTIGENVVNIDAKTCKDAKKLTKVTVKSGKLTKKAIKNLLKGSKIKTIKLSGPAAKAMKKQYQKWAGKKAKVK